MPGVYIQGLLIYNADGSIMVEESLREDLCHEVIALGKELGADDPEAVCHGPAIMLRVRVAM